jgi:T5orf172 domain
MEIGFVYIITTKLYEPLDIFKIGCTKNIEQRLKTINATRTTFDKFYIVNCIKTFHYFKLEGGLHQILRKYRLNNEFFQCSVEKIEEAISEYVNNNVFLLHDDKIAEEAENRNLKWLPKGNMFSIANNGVEIYFNETRLIEEIKQWISIFDKHDLYRFLHESHFYTIIAHLKDNFKYPCDDMTDISIEMNKLFAGSEKDIEYDLEKLMGEMTLNSFVDIM